MDTDSHRSRFSLFLSLLHTSYLTPPAHIPHAHRHRSPSAPYLVLRPVPYHRSLHPILSCPLLVFHLPSAQLPSCFVSCGCVRVEQFASAPAFCLFKNPFARSLAHLLVYTLTCSFARLLACLFACLLARSPRTLCYPFAHLPISVF